MADKNRRSERSPADDDAFVDQPFDDVDDELLVDDEAEPGRTRRGGRLAAKTVARPAATAKAATRPRSSRPGRLGRLAGAVSGLFRRLALFIREVVAELRKVIWPTRKELLTYTSVVVVFVALVMTIVAALDYGFAKGLLWVFGKSGE